MQALPPPLCAGASLGSRDTPPHSSLCWGWLAGKGTDLRPGQWGGKLRQGAVFCRPWLGAEVSPEISHTVIPVLSLCSRGPMQSVERAFPRAVAWVML